MTQEIGDAIQLLEKAKSEPTDKAVELVNEAINLLFSAVKNPEGPDLDRGS